MKNFKINPIISRPLFRFNSSAGNIRNYSDNTIWTVTTISTTVCVQPTL